MRTHAQWIADNLLHCVHVHNSSFPSLIHHREHRKRHFSLFVEKVHRLVVMPVCLSACMCRYPPRSLLSMPTGVMPLSLMMRQNNLALMRLSCRICHLYIDMPGGRCKRSFGNTRRHWSKEDLVTRTQVTACHPSSMTTRYITWRKKSGITAADFKLVFSNYSA